MNGPLLPLNTGFFGTMGLGGSMLTFFFQAEDGIRDIGVTGVQTCALPISDRRLLVPPGPGPLDPGGELGVQPGLPRSEERRVGKECSSRLSPHQGKNSFRDASNGNSCDRNHRHEHDMEFASTVACVSAVRL